MTEPVDLVIPPRDCTGDQALDLSVQHARRASQLASSHNPTCRYHAAAAAAWAQVASALFVRDQETGR